jgi:hypothetical protein
MSNLHPVDQLVAIRAQIKALQELESTVKTEVSRLIGGSETLTGNEWTAIQSLSTRKGGLDEKALKAAGIDTEAYRKDDISVLTIRTVLRASLAA